MSGIPPRGLALLVLASLAAAAGAPADDWPQWLGPQRNGVWRETGILDKFPEGGPPVRWRTPIAAGYAGPAVAGGRVYVLDRTLAKDARNPDNPFQRGSIAGTERVLCLNEANGQPLWQHSYDCPYTISYASGPRCTPVVGGGKVYALGAEGNLLCLDAERGTVLWSKDFKKDYGANVPTWGFAAHPLLDGKKLICVVGGKGSAAVAFDKDTGKEIWRGLTSDQPGYCPPMIYTFGGKRELIIWHPEAISGLDPETGAVYWSQPVSTYEGMTIATPRQRDDTLFITGAGEVAVLFRVRPDQPTAEVVWRGNKKDKGFFSTFSTPFFDEGYIYGSNGQTGALECIKADTGERVWQTTKPNGIAKAPSGDIFVIKNGDRFFLVTEKGDLIIARLSPQGYDEISRAHVLDPTNTAWGRNVVWSHPAFANRSVYARNDKEIVCVSLAEGQK